LHPNGARDLLEADDAFRVFQLQAPDGIILALRVTGAGLYQTALIIEGQRQRCSFDTDISAQLQRQQQAEP
jgi:hypothetical protein